MRGCVDSCVEKLHTRSGLLAPDLFQELFDLYEEPRDRFRTIELKSLVLRILLGVERDAEKSKLRFSAMVHSLAGTVKQ